MTAPIRIAIAGALGRMGQAIAAVVEARDDVVLVARFDRPDVTAAGLVSRDEALAACDVVIDFTTPAASVALAQHCAARGGPALVIGATGISEEDGALIDACAAQIPIVRARNFSLGVNMLMSLVSQAARALAASDYDIEVFEAHHRRKVDSPSGTALMLGEAAAEGRGVNLNDVADRGRDGITGPRKTGDIGFSVLRGGDIIGEHSVIFAAEDEILTLSHSARDRGLFARGAVQAALWVGSQPKGAYDMQDVLRG
ncbi:4-hydroxy-tetrahydrodipicolinate reductase [Phenylobacterium sp.]|uniref:4-hydroxy-tetrahydrodipicolinate reductase n=1 Tax=Phenylobacterium sp. TaxID=1871053 RepID=UPI00271D6D30|nr:4-hydroxy-tetrahydrodipicolinate reductase [Phenylobacterium sp.]MDO8798875.1 4-hydroxy-tetrahydrodipicolinate reductase [Phenylobacterium sp.]